MDNSTLFILLVGIVAVGMLIMYKDKLKISLKGLGFSLDAEGSNQDSVGRVPSPAEHTTAAQVGDAVVASGERAVAAGNKVNIKGPIITGDRNRTSALD